LRFFVRLITSPDIIPATRASFNYPSNYVFMFFVHGGIVSDWWINARLFFGFLQPP